MVVNRRFKLLHGIHNEGGKTYYPGDVIDSASDLSKHNRPSNVRYEPVAEETDDPLGSADTLQANPVPLESGAPLESLTIAQLRQLAEEYEVDLGDAAKKGEIIDALQTEGVGCK